MVSVKVAWILATRISGYHPLLFTLAETGEVLRLTNRGGNSQSGHNAFKDADRIIALCKEADFKRIMLRGDTAFTQTDHLDRWDEDNVEFVFGIAKHKNLMAKIDEIADDQWKPVPRDPSYDPSTPNRARPTKVKRQIIAERVQEPQIEGRSLCGDTLPALQVR